MLRSGEFFDLIFVIYIHVAVPFLYLSSGPGASNLISVFIISSRRKSWLLKKFLR